MIAGATVPSSVASSTMAAVPGCISRSASVTGVAVDITDRPGVAWRSVSTNEASSVTTATVCEVRAMGATARSGAPVGIRTAASWRRVVISVSSRTVPPPPGCLVWRAALPDVLPPPQMASF